MPLTMYLAMTAAETLGCTQLPEPMAWMACHFSPYGNGISNIPDRLPKGAMLILNDRIPPRGHDPKTVAGQLARLTEEFSVSRVLLDMQRPDCPETTQILRIITQTLPCPVAATPAYAAELSCAVLLTPALRKPLTEQLVPWNGREIWLDATPDCERITVTEHGSTVQPGHIPASPQVVHTDAELRCQYCLELDDACANFTVWRDREQLELLLQDAEKAGISCAVGLYQQLHTK